MEKHDIIPFSDTITFRRIKTNSGARILLFSNDNKQLIYSEQGGVQINVVDIATLSNAWTFDGHEKVVIYMELSRDGTKLVSSACDSTVRIWCMETRKCLMTITHGRHHMNYAKFDKQAKFVFTSLDYQFTVTQWSVETGLIVYRFVEFRDHINGIAVFDDCKTLVASTKSDQLVFWDIETGERTSMTKNNLKIRGDIVISPDQTRLLTTSNWPLMYLFDRNGQKICERYDVKLANDDEVRARFTPDSKYVVVMARHSRIHILTAANLTEIMMIHDARCEFDKFCASLDTTTYAIAAEVREIHVFAPVDVVLATFNLFQMHVMRTAKEKRRTVLPREAIRVIMRYYYNYETRLRTTQ